MYDVLFFFVADCAGHEDGCYFFVLGLLARGDDDWFIRLASAHDDGTALHAGEYFVHVLDADAYLHGGSLVFARQGFGSLEAEILVLAE